MDAAEMGRLPRTTIEQWAVLRAVVALGGFAQAADSLHRSQSSVSYAVAQLQLGLGIELLKTEGRRSVLTETGRALLAEASPLIDDLNLLELRAQAIKGSKARVRLVVDSLYPKDRLFAALREFAKRHPAIEVNLRETVHITFAEIAGAFDLAILVADFNMRDIERVMDVELIAVARRDHALVRKGGRLHKSTLARYPRVDIRGMEAGDPANAEVSAKSWRMSTVEAAIAAVRKGLCYGWLPRNLIAEDLMEKSLVTLPLEAGASRLIPLGLTFSDSSRNDPAVMLLAELLELEPAEPVSAVTTRRRTSRP